MHDDEYLYTGPADRIKLLAAAWNRLQPEERAKYDELSRQDKCARRAAGRVAATGGVHAASRAGWLYGGDAGAAGAAAGRRRTLASELARRNVHVCPPTARPARLRNKLQLEELLPLDVTLKELTPVQLALLKGALEARQQGKAGERAREAPFEGGEVGDRSPARRAADTAAPPRPTSCVAARTQTGRAARATHSICL